MTADFAVSHRWLYNPKSSIQSKSNQQQTPKHIIVYCKWLREKWVCPV